MFKFGTSNTSLGVDIGNSTIKIVQMKKGANGPQLTGLAIEPVPENALVDGSISDPKIISDIIKNLRRANGLRTDNCVTALAAQNAILRFVPFPVMPDPELEIAVRNEAEHYVPYSLDEVHIDFSRLAQIEEEGMSRYLVLLVVAQKEYVGTLEGVFKDAGISLDAVDVDTLAVLNALENSIKANMGARGGGGEGEGGEGMEGGGGGADGKGEVLAVISIGARTTNVNILKDGILRFTRPIPIAGNNITAVIQNVFKESFAEAERTKIEEGVLGMEGGEEGDQEFTEVVQTTIEELAGEIRRSFDYFKAQTREPLIHRVILTGGSSKLKNLDMFLTNEFGIDVEMADPLAGIEVAVGNPELLQEYLQDFTTAIGLALRGVTAG
ncbi:MAG: type IV pilus assembly protein PilM [Candidatus Riflebacteria bacterium]|nr:type IV pilus assembly protein PilM [Candidatus Riflebacteria bacterium]